MGGFRALSLPLARSERELPREHCEITEVAPARDVDRACALLVAHFELMSSILLTSERHATAIDLRQGGLEA